MVRICDHYSFTDDDNRWPKVIKVVNGNRFAYRELSDEDFATWKFLYQWIEYDFKTKHRVTKFLEMIETLFHGKPNNEKRKR